MMMIIFSNVLRNKDQQDKLFSLDLFQCCKYSKLPPDDEKLIYTKHVEDY
jgi:hypothetical protein